MTDDTETVEAGIAEAPPKRFGLLVDLEGVAFPVRETLAGALREGLDAALVPELTPGFLCRHLVDPSSTRVAKSVAEALGLRAGVRDTLRKALDAAITARLSEGSAAWSDGWAQLSDKATALDFAACLVADGAGLEIPGIEDTGILLVAGDSGKGECGGAAWSKAVRRLGVTPPACVALVGGAAACRNALLAGVGRVIAVLDAYNGGHDFSGADTMVAALADVELAVPRGGV